MKISGNVMMTSDEKIRLKELIFEKGVVVRKRRKIYSVASDLSCVDEILPSLPFLKLSERDQVVIAKACLQTDGHFTDKHENERIPISGKRQRRISYITRVVDSFEESDFPILR